MLDKDTESALEWLCNNNGVLECSRWGETPWFTVTVPDCSRLAAAHSVAEAVEAAKHVVATLVEREKEAWAVIEREGDEH